MAGYGRMHRPMKRRLFTIFSLLSLILCLAACLMWYRSYSIAEEAVCYRSSSHDRYIVASHPGRIVAEILHEAGTDGTSILFYPNPGTRGFWAYSIAGSPNSDWESYYFRDNDYLLRRGTFAIVAGLRLTPGPDRPYLFDSLFPIPATGASVPYWFPVVLAAVPPALAARRLQRRWHRRPHGLCGKCGYDLRASPERCPECGTPISQLSDTGTSAD